MEQARVSSSSFGRVHNLREEEEEAEETDVSWCRARLIRRSDLWQRLWAAKLQLLATGAIGFLFFVLFLREIVLPMHVNFDPSLLADIIIRTESSMAQNGSGSDNRTFWQPITENTEGIGDTVHS